MFPRAELEVELQSLAYGGDAVGRAGGKVVFVPLGAPGDRVRIRQVQDRTSWLRGEILQVLRPGPARRHPPCELAGRCGGCPWLHLEYEAQLRAKTEILASSPLGRVAAGLEAVIPSPRELCYRRRVRLHWEKRAGTEPVLGLFGRRSQELLDIPRCPLLLVPLQGSLAGCRKLLSFLEQGRGTLALLAGEGGEVHLSLRGTASGPREVARLGDAAKDLVRAGPVTGGLIKLGRQRIELGADTVGLEPGGGAPLRATAAVFAQANPWQETALVQRVGRWAAGASGPVLELFAGLGTMTAALARPDQEVLAVEASFAAASLLRQNARRMGGPVTVLQAEALAALCSLVEQGRRFETVVLDPPREGCPGLAAPLSRSGAGRVIYVACDPMTLARDLQALGQVGFAVREVMALDMMPQTFHVELAVLLER